MVEIVGVRDGPLLDEVRRLFAEYADGLGIDLSFQDFASELAGLPGDYAAPGGTLLVAFVGGAAAGCVAVRRLGAGSCEMKRLFVRPAFQGTGCGRRLAARSIEWARAAGYDRMRLDTLPSMDTAQRMYARLGFRDVPAYRFNPIAGTRFMELALLAARDLTADAALVDSTARLLFDAFRGRPAAWPTLESARQEVLESLAPDRISRVMADDAGAVFGWVGAIPIYDGRVWDVHPIVVSATQRRHGIGRALIADLERLAAARGVLTLWAGSDDELDQTTLGGADLYTDIPAAMRSIRNLRGHSYEFFLRVGFQIAGVLPDANGPGKPDIFLAKRVSAA